MGEVYLSVLSESECMYVQSSLVQSSMYIMHDGFGIMVSFGMTSAPFFESILSRNVFSHPRDPCYADLVASAVLFGKCLMFVMCNLANPAAESRHGGLYVLLLFIIYLIFF